MNLRKYPQIFILLYLCTLHYLVKAQQDSVFKIVGFFKGNIQDVDKYDFQKLTHVIFSFVHLKGNAIALDNVSDEATLKKLVALKSKYPQLKVMIAFGGWGGCETCSAVFNEASNRTAFVESVHVFLEKYQLDGIDMDWESPVIGGYGNHLAQASDKDNFTALMQLLRQRLSKDKLICFDANTFSSFLTQSIDWKAVLPYVDWVNLMSYTLPGDQKGTTHPHAALYSSAMQTESLDKAVQFFKNMGIEMQKLYAGAAFYGIQYVQVDSIHQGLYQKGVFKAYLNYHQIYSMQQSNPNYQLIWDDSTQSHHLYDAINKVFITYDSEKAVAEKVRYAKANGMGGIFFWRLNGDVAKNGLLEAIYQASLDKKK